MGRNNAPKITLIIKTINPPKKPIRTSFPFEAFSFINFLVPHLLLIRKPAINELIATDEEVSVGVAPKEINNTSWINPNSITPVHINFFESIIN